MSGKTVAVLEGAQSDMIASGETTDYGEVKDAKSKKNLKTYFQCSHGAEKR